MIMANEFWTWLTYIFNKCVDFMCNVRVGGFYPMEIFTGFLFTYFVTKIVKHVYDNS